MPSSNERSDSEELFSEAQTRIRQRRRPSPPSTSTLDRSRNAGNEVARLLADVGKAARVPHHHDSRNTRTHHQRPPGEGMNSRNERKRRAESKTAPEAERLVVDYNTPTLGKSTEPREAIPERYSTVGSTAELFTSSTVDSAPVRKQVSVVRKPATQNDEPEVAITGPSLRGKQGIVSSKDSRKKTPPTPQVVSYSPRTPLRPLLEKIPITPPMLGYNSPIHLVLKTNPYACLAHDSTKEDGTSLSLHGKRLGRGDELWTVEPVQRSSSSKFVSFGETVRVVNSSATKKHYLSCVRNENRNENDFEIVATPLEDDNGIWTLHTATETIPVGRSTLKNNSSCRPVRIGDTFVLRNSLHNGVVSSSKLALITDAHGQDVVAGGEEDEDFVHPDDPPTALTRLHRAHRLVPSDKELWCVDMLPLPFLDATYLWKLDGGERYKPPMDARKLDELLFGSVAAEDNKDGDKTIDTHHQEKILVDEIIGACMGFEGEYIQADASRHPLRFVLNEPVSGTPFDKIWRSLVHDILELPAAFAILRRFIAQHSDSRYRQVLSQELATEMDLHRKTVLVSLDEQTDMTLAQLRHTLLQTVLPVLTDWVKAAASERGNRLVQVATVPYRHQLRDWVERGILPEHDGIIRAVPHQVWTERFEWASNELCEPATVLECLSDDRISQQVLATGRYWHAIRVARRSHQREANLGCATKVCDLTPASIQACYQNASQELIDILFRKENGLLDSLKLVKGFWLLEYGDVFLEFMNKAQVELLKPLDMVSCKRLQHWMNTCCVETPPLCRLVTGHWIKDQGITPQRQPERNLGIHSFGIDLPPIPFPVSLILSRRAVERYQHVCQHLFFLKFVKWRAVNVWRDDKDLKRIRNEKLSPAFLLRQRMIHFLENMLHYMVAEVIDPQWAQLQEAIAQKGLTVDSICAIHNEFQESVFEACFLNHRSLARSFNKILKTCHSFSVQMNIFRSAIQPDPAPVKRCTLLVGTARQRLKQASDARREQDQKMEHRVACELGSPKFQRMVSRHSTVWSQHVNEFVAQLTPTTHSQLLTRLDFNGYVTQSL